MDCEELFKRCVEFHGHSCGGLLIGFRAAAAAMEILGINEPCADEEIVCVAENDACGIDAIQALLGCTAGKGNLIFRLRGKQAFSFYDRRNGKSFRLALKSHDFASKEEKHRFMNEAQWRDIFSYSPTTEPIPNAARIFKSQPCSICGETTAEPWLRINDGRAVCLDCLEREFGA